MITTEWKPNKRVVDRIKNFDKTFDNEMKSIIPDARKAMEQTIKNEEGRSKAGNPPAIDSGELIKGLRIRKIKAFHYEYRSTAPYSEALEFGTPTMPARPFFMIFAKKHLSAVFKNLTNLFRGL